MKLMMGDNCETKLDKYFVLSGVYIHFNVSFYKVLLLQPSPPCGCRGSRAIVIKVKNKTKAAGIVKTFAMPAAFVIVVLFVVYFPNSVMSLRPAMGCTHGLFRIHIFSL